MGYRYVVLGAGRQGVAAAYDLALHGQADEVVLADRNEEAAQAGAARVNALVGRSVVTPKGAHAAHLPTVRPLLEGAHGLVSAVPYKFNLSLTELAIRMGVHMVDLGGHTGVVRRQLALSPHAQRAGVTVVPDCGMGPGLNITLALLAMEALDEPQEVRIYDGGLPQENKPPWGYVLLFSAEGLVNEYSGEAFFLRNGRVTPVPALSELEELEIPGLGRLEAFVTSGGLSTMPWTFEGRLQVLENKTLRYPGHCRLLWVLRDLGLFGENPVDVGGVEVVPRDVLAALLARAWYDPQVKDLAVIYVVARGRKDGYPAEATVQLVDLYDERTGFRAMEKLTGWHAAMVLELAVRGEIPRGVIPIEQALPGSKFAQLAPARGWNVDLRVKRSMS